MNKPVGGTSCLHDPRFLSWTHPCGLLAARLGRLSAAASIVPAHNGTARRGQASGLAVPCKGDDVAGYCPQGGATTPGALPAAQAGA
ncbi:MAG: hypothetical protein GW907_01355 [Betaproteobacteria bacterium]|nr:hypothetical protein [Betaproteobacteria bacterium]NCP81239.1 hypothetical protein [Rhodoferax sp.]